MQINRSTTNKKHLILGIIIVIAIGIAGGTYYYSHAKTNDQVSPKASPTANAVNYSPPTDHEINTGNQQKDNTVNNQPDSDHPAASNNLDTTFTAVNQNGTTVQIRSLTTQTITGSCDLTITNGSVSKAYTATAQALANGTTCSGFDIPASDLGAGSWSLKLIVTSSDNKKGEASTTLEVR